MPNKYLVGFLGVIGAMYVIESLVGYLGVPRFKATDLGRKLQIVVY